MSRLRDLTGEKFGRLLVIERALGKKRRSDGRHEVYWLVRCNCGKEITVRGGALKSGNTTSCGCKLKETLLKRNLTHGMTKTKSYECWQNMRRRCQDSQHVAFKNYGARGITVCERWKKFENFLEDMGLQPAGLTLERKDNNTGYSPENCTWATRLEQSRNSRKAHLLTHNGETLTMRQWERKLGLRDNHISKRLQRGWSVRKSLETPSQGTMEANANAS